MKTIVMNGVEKEVAFINVNPQNQMCTICFTDKTMLPLTDVKIVVQEPEIDDEVVPINIPKGPYETVEYFIKQNGYTWSVEDIVHAFKHEFGKVYVSYTMNHCCTELKDELETLIRLEELL